MKGIATEVMALAVAVVTLGCGEDASEDASEDALVGYRFFEKPGFEHVADSLWVVWGGNSISNPVVF